VSIGDEEARYDERMSALYVEHSQEDFDGFTKDVCNRITSTISK
jgi:hypothetical protein